MPAALPTVPRVLPPIRRALDAGAPIVALETSVLAQGLPIPHNAEAARRMRGAVEAEGAVAAWTAVACGVPTVGLEDVEMSRLLARTNVRKVSARDLGIAVSQHADGATTVAAALVLGHLSGIRVLATGGIGGVHRSVGPHRIAAPDESADLGELARTPMVVVCSGAKAILDLPATWERLDTLGVPVIGFGTDELPGFYTRRTGIRLGAVAESVEEIAMAALAHFGLRRPQAVVVVQPPDEAVALDARKVEDAVAAALRDAAYKEVTGPDVTPFLLDAVSRETGGESLLTNLTLLEDNAGLAGRIARALQQFAGGQS